MLVLVNELALYEKAPQEVTITLAQFKEAGFGQNPVWQAFVAEVNGTIVGFALFYVRFSTWKGKSLYLEDFIVTENMRGKGIGKLLFERTIAEAKQKGYLSMVWQVLDWNQPALNFYAKYNSGIEAGWLNASLSKKQLDEFTM
ncbi:MAG: GNAT family N-acetyltransferase [Sphingobacteriales bacterium]|nr:MAG: GNAT family N-acetyltransferase [Sphingobacteriales bacterium]TAF84018.1 MAG: GNAT family N-acetyltransferase [Sphingobacteriales bacterium]